MSRLRRIPTAVWGFVVGDDPLVALGVVLGLGLTALVGRWWILPPVVLALLVHSLWRAGQ